MCTCACVCICGVGVARSICFRECEFPVLPLVRCVAYSVLLCVSVYVVCVTACAHGARYMCVYLSVPLCGASSVQVWEYLLIPGLFEHPRAACMSL